MLRRERPGRLPRKRKLPGRADAEEPPEEQSGLLTASIQPSLFVPLRRAHFAEAPDSGAGCRRRRGRTRRIRRRRRRADYPPAPPRHPSPRPCLPASSACGASSCPQRPGRQAQPRDRTQRREEAGPGPSSRAPRWARWWLTRRPFRRLRRQTGRPRNPRPDRFAPANSSARPRWEPGRRKPDAGSGRGCRRRKKEPVRRRGGGRPSDDPGGEDADARSAKRSPFPVAVRREPRTASPTPPSRRPDRRTRTGRQTTAADRRPATAPPTRGRVRRSVADASGAPAPAWSGGDAPAVRRRSHRP